MKIVDSNSDEEIARHRAHDELTHQVRKLTANLLRVIAGGGHPHLLEGMFVAVAEAATEARRVGAPRFRAHRQMLDLAHVLCDHRPWVGTPAEQDARRSAFDADLDDIVTGALRMAAATLADQLTQHAAAQRIVCDAIRRRRDARTGQ